MNQYKKLAKYIKGTSRALNVLADEIEKDKDFSRESERLLSKIGAELLFHAKSFTFLKK